MVGAGPQAPSPPVLELSEVMVPGRGQPRLQNIDLLLHAGERVALLGASGSGKSTLLAVANGLIQPKRGQVLWHGEQRAKSRRRLRRQQARIGTLWQDLRLIEELTVQQNLNAGRLSHWGWPRGILNLLLPLETEACIHVLRSVNLNPNLLNQSVEGLSGGQRQRVALGRLLRQDPVLWLADEPLASLDPSLAKQVLQLLLSQTAAPKALLLSLHRPDLLTGFDRVIGLRAGQVVLDQTMARVDERAVADLYSTTAEPRSDRNRAAITVPR